eukprot:Skav225840  [mRNA]  locus=scaffold345:111467:123154:+ [translate_table: standard]
MAEGRVYNFSAGPSVMPLEVLEEVQREMVNYKGCGMSVMEMSHRSKEFMAIAAEAEKNLRDIFGVPSDYKVLMLQGGATLQFSAIPLNMLGTKTKADYLVTGQWGEKAHKECNKYGTGQLACNTKPTKFTTIPQKSEWKLDSEAAYVHYCANETVNGVEFSHTPDVGDVPLVADMSSNFCSKPIEVSKHAFIYAGIQKNLGPAGMSVGFLRPDFADGSKEMKICPTYCSFKTTGDNGSMYNTPACFTMYVMGEYLKYTKKVGGLPYWAEQSDKKSSLLYGTIDGSNGFYNCPVEKSARSRMNVPFTINGGDEALEKKFLDEAKKHKLFTLAGHRSVGGCRASLYNGMPLEGDGVEEVDAHLPPMLSALPPVWGGGPSPIADDIETEEVSILEQPQPSSNWPLPDQEADLPLPPFAFPNLAPEVHERQPLEEVSDHLDFPIFDPVPDQTSWTLVPEMIVDPHNETALAVPIPHQDVPEVRLTILALDDDRPVLTAEVYRKPSCQPLLPYFSPMIGDSWPPQNVCLHIHDRGPQDASVVLQSLPREPQRRDDDKENVIEGSQGSMDAEVDDSPPEEIQKPLKSTNLVECGVSEWDNEYVNIEQEVLFELILAANYLDIKSLLDLTCAKAPKTECNSTVICFLASLGQLLPGHEAQVREENRAQLRRLKRHTAENQK